MNSAEKSKLVRGAFLATFNETLTDVVEEIFKGNVSDDMTKHLVSKANGFHKREERNETAWIRFVLDLDNKNLEVITRFFETIK